MARNTADFTMFMAGNVLKDETIEYVASKRMGTPVLNDNGEPTGEIEPVAWKIKAIDSDLDEKIRKESTKKIPVAGKRGQFTLDTDNELYIGKMCAASIVYPDLNNAELQDSYKVKKPDELLKKMLLPGEYTELKAKVMEVNGYDLGMEELVDEAKN